METWAWLLAYVVGFGLLQLALYHHFRRNDATPDSPARTGEGGGSKHLEDPGDEPEGPTVYCQECGARNQRFSTVRYCHSCVSPLR